MKIREIISESQEQIDELFTTKGNGKWSSQLDDEMVEYNFTASNGQLYRVDFLASHIGPDEMSPYDFHDHMISDKAYESAKFVEFSQVTKKNPRGFTDKRGTGSAAEVFGTVVNAMLEYIKKYKPSMLYFQAVEPNRQRLYAVMAKRLVQSLRGWGVSLNGGQIAVYNKRKTAEQPVSEGELDEARKRKTKRKAKSKRHSSSNRSPVPRFYGAWGFGDGEGGDGGGE
jgi:hypothetical protein